ncbi:MAG: hypothetical protein RJB60_1274, partial [Pseudomonadota bacterium]
MRQQISGRGTQQALVGHDAPGQHAGIGRRAELDAQVHGVGGEVQRLVGELQHHLDLRVAFHKGRDGRRQVPSPKPESGIDAQEPARLIAAGSQRALQTV